MGVKFFHHLEKAFAISLVFLGKSNARLSSFRHTDPWPNPSERVSEERKLLNEALYLKVISSSYYFTDVQDGDEEPEYMVENLEIQTIPATAGAVVDGVTLKAIDRGVAYLEYRPPTNCPLLDGGTMKRGNIQVNCETFYEHGICDDGKIKSVQVVLSRRNLLDVVNQTTIDEITNAFIQGVDWWQQCLIDNLVGEQAQKCSECLSFQDDMYDGGGHYCDETEKECAAVVKYCAQECGVCAEQYYKYLYTFSPCDLSCGKGSYSQCRELAGWILATKIDNQAPILRTVQVGQSTGISTKYGKFTVLIESVIESTTVIVYNFEPQSGSTAECQATSARLEIELGKGFQNIDIPCQWWSFELSMNLIEQNETKGGIDSQECANLHARYETCFASELEPNQRGECHQCQQDTIEGTLPGNPTCDDLDMLCSKIHECGCLTCTDEYIAWQRCEALVLYGCDVPKCRAELTLNQ